MPLNTWSLLHRTLPYLSKALDSPLSMLFNMTFPGFSWRIPHSCSLDKVYVPILQCMDASVWLRFSQISFCLGIWLCLHYLLEDYMCTLVLAFSLIMLNEGLVIHCMCFCYDVLVESVCCHHNLWFLWWDGVSLQVSFLLPCQVCIPCLASASK